MEGHIKSPSAASNQFLNNFTRCTILDGCRQKPAFFFNEEKSSWTLFGGLLCLHPLYTEHATSPYRDSFSVITYVQYHKERRKICTSVISHYIPDRHQQQQEQQKWQSHIMHITNNQSNITIKNVYHIWTLQKRIKHLEPQHMQQGKQHDSEVSMYG